MLRLIIQSAYLEIEDTTLTAELLKNQQVVEAKAKADELIRGGHVRYVCAGAKNYRVSELAVREFLGDR
jgi:hypothetical protein